MHSVVKGGSAALAFNVESIAYIGDFGRKLAFDQGFTILDPNFLDLIWTLRVGPTWTAVERSLT
jgi:hypothetical protein